MAEFTNGWKPYEGGKILSDSKDFLQHKLHVESIQGHEIVFAGDEAAALFLEENGFSPVGNLGLPKGKDWR